MSRGEKLRVLDPVGDIALVDLEPAPRLDTLDGKVIGATLTKDRNGYQNHAYRLDGIDDYLQLENFPSSSSFTVSILVKLGLGYNDSPLS